MGEAKYCCFHILGSKWIHETAQEVGGRATDPFSFALISDALPTPSLLLVVCEPKKANRGQPCLHRHNRSTEGHPDFQTEAEVLCAYFDFSLRLLLSPHPQEKKRILSWDMSSKELLHFLCLLFCSKSRYNHLPITKPQTSFTCLPVLLIFISCW